MQIALHDGDAQVDFPNYALMKISAWHKSRGEPAILHLPGVLEETERQGVKPNKIQSRR